MRFQASSLIAPSLNAEKVWRSSRASGMMLSSATPRRLDLRVLALDLLDEQLHECAPLVRIQGHQLTPRPVQVICQKEDFLAQLF